jgi:hypothetical protein
VQRAPATPGNLASAPKEFRAAHLSRPDQWQTLGAFEALHVVREVAVGVKPHVEEGAFDCTGVLNSGYAVSDEEKVRWAKCFYLRRRLMMADKNGSANGQRAMTADMRQNASTSRRSAVGRPLALNFGSATITLPSDNTTPRTSGEVAERGLVSVGMSSKIAGELQ